MREDKGKRSKVDKIRHRGKKDAERKKKDVLRKEIDILREKDTNEDRYRNVDNEIRRKKKTQNFI